VAPQKFFSGGAIKNFTWAVDIKLGSGREGRGGGGGEPRQIPRRGEFEVPETPKKLLFS